MAAILRGTLSLVLNARSHTKKQAKRVWMPGVIDKVSFDLRAKIELELMSLDNAYDAVKAEYQQTGVDAEWFTALDEAKAAHTARIDGIERLGVGRRLRGQRPEKWYDGSPPNARFWPQYKAHLVAKGWGEQIESIDDASSSVVSMLPRPGRPRFSGRGLVLGYVQSGKTANMTAVIAKAADRNYQLIIVLAGMTNKLRDQTQKRFVKDLLSHDTEQIWQCHTTEDSDFCEPRSPGFVFGSQYRHILVVKKETNILGRLYDKLQNTNQMELVGCPALIIDDECDQASTNSSGSLENMTRINEHIRNIIAILPRAAYVGYTATPFANVLIDPTIAPDVPEDLYPRDFIYTLDRSDDYFGAERIFGRDMLDADVIPPESEDLDILREIPADEWDQLRPRNARERDTFEFEVSDSLERSILYYVLATAVRDLRGDRKEHSSMLVHTTMLVNPQFQIANGIENFVKTIKRRHASNDGSVMRQLKSVWDEEGGRVRAEVFGLTNHSFEDLEPYLGDVLDAIEVAVENGESDSRVVYEKENEDDDGKRYIVVGGNVLARGLTIEGLVVSFFLRTSAQYCTLMQMGRWFGYRHNYEDLPRIWMTLEMQNNFFALATVEAEIRYEIEVYERSEMTPIDCAVKIRKLPGLAITAKNKMMAAQRCILSLNGKHRQTRRFKHKDVTSLQDNWTAGSVLIQEAVNDGCTIKEKRQGRLLSGVSVEHIEKFLRNYEIHKDHPDLVEYRGNTEVNHVLQHIRNQNANDGSHSIWNVGIVEPDRGSPSDNELGPLGQVRTVNRSKFQGLESGDVDIKALMSKGDLKIDLDSAIAVPDDWDEIKSERLRHDESNRPLLLLYAIKKDSQPARANSSRKALEAVADILGVGFVFAGEPGEDDAVYYVQVDVEQDLEQEEAVPEEIDE